MLRHSYRTRTTKGEFTVCVITAKCVKVYSNKPSTGRQKRAPPASTPYICVFCKENAQSTNYRRHLIMKHHCRIDGTPATSADIEQAHAWSARTPASRNE